MGDEKARGHVLRCWPREFQAIASGRKRFEWRLDDERYYRVGDLLILNEWDPLTRMFTGETCTMRVTYLLDSSSPFGVPNGYVVMSIEPAHGDHTSTHQGGR